MIQVVSGVRPELRAVDIQAATDLPSDDHGTKWFPEQIGLL